jgi:hypothetical protein
MVHLRLAGWFVFAASFALEAVAIVRADQAWLVHRLFDDSYYYLEIGQRVSRGEGATFDGLHVTTGFHPLWLVVVVMIAVVLSGAALVKCSLLVALVMYAGALLIIHRLLRPVVGRNIALLAVLTAA